jgi:protein subunit release factor A
MGKELLFSLTKKDFVVETYKGSGPGGQYRNKTETGIRITHPPSGAVGQSCDERSQLQNKQTAFERLVKSPKFQKWHKVEVAKRTGATALLEQEVDRSMSPNNLRVESVDPDTGRWVVCPS